MTLKSPVLNFLSHTWGNVTSPVRTPLSSPRSVLVRLSHATILKASSFPSYVCFAFCFCMAYYKLQQYTPGGLVFYVFLCDKVVVLRFQKPQLESKSLISE